ncbi:hypothetical protein EQG64_25490 [Streptomyces sp. S6]|nr:hypothetical protein EQG64_25490 [Streptomyces sp. S6]
MPLPVVPDPAGPPPAGPAPAATPRVRAAALSVRVPPRPPRPRRERSRHHAPDREAPDQGDARGRAGLAGVPVKAVPPKSARPTTIQRSDTTDAADITGTPDTTPTETTAPANRITGAELDALARRLIDPVSRLIRADMRRGRERAGRPHDGRR